MMLYQIFPVLLVGSILVSDTDGSLLSGNPHNASDGRLPRGLSPFHYRVELTPEIYDSGPPFKFSGVVDISFTVIKPTSLITLNSKELSIESSPMNVTVDRGQPGNPADPVISNWTLDAKAEFLEVELTDPLAVNTNYSIKVGFTGTIRDDSTGLFLDSYTAANGSTKYIATTQFEPQRGRLAFPCFDEPEFKATFKTIINYKPPYVSFANMPRSETKTGEHGWVADIYETTPKMSLYLFAFAVGDFHKLEAESVHGHQVGILARPEIIPQMEFARKCAPPILDWLDNETGITYREPKLDYIAFPLSLVGMENWGLVTILEQEFAVSNETSSTFGKQCIAMFIGHESAHQWYGNLVTCKWWNDIWLNEGFATYYNYRATQGLGWEGSKASQVDTQKFLEDDQRNSSDPVRKDIPTVWDARKSFRGSTYPKGGAIVQFLEGILTTQTFKRGLKKYLLKHQYGSVTTDDLWQSLTEQAAVDNIKNPDGSALDVKLRMDPWLNQMGFPLISVTRRKDGTAIVAQSHFLRPPNQIMNTTSPYNYRWHVPITVVSKSSKPDDWDAAPSAYIDIDKNRTIVSGFPRNLSRWAMINAKAMFYYRVKYDKVSFDAIVAQLLANKNVIHVQSRSQFIDDAFSVARAGYFPETWAMNSTLYLKKEHEWGPWSSALRHLKYSDRLIRNHTLGSLQRSYILSLAIPIYKRLGWNYAETETPFRHFLRRDMIDVTCTYGHAPCLAKARSQYALIKKDPSSNVVNANNLPLVLCAGISEGTEADWQMSFDQYLARKSSPIKEERLAYLFGCTCTSDERLLDRLLEELVTNVTWFEKLTLAEYLSKTDYGAQILWNYLDTNWTSILSAGAYRMTQLRAIALGFSTQAELDKLYAFRDRNQPDASEEALFTNLILDVEANVKWVQTQGPALEQWLLKNTPKSLNVQKRNKRSVNLPGFAMEHWETVRRSYLSDYHKF